LLVGLIMLTACSGGFDVQRSALEGETPPATKEAAVAWDPARKALVVFGGAVGKRAVADTWEWRDGVGDLMAALEQLVSQPNLVQGADVDRARLAVALEVLAPRVVEQALDLIPQPGRHLRLILNPACAHVIPHLSEGCVLAP
jgi:hypothetical protein